MMNNKTILGHVLNWSPDLPDQRDFLYKVTAPIALPDKIDLRPGMPPIVNQGSIGSCTANALAGNLGYLYMQQLQVKGKQSQEFSSKKFIPASRLFIYYNARALIGTQKIDSGSYIRDGIKTLNQLGVCREDIWKYEKARLFKAPTKGPVNEALKYKISNYQRLISIDDMKQCLAEGNPFNFGFSVYESFDSTGVAGTGAVPLPKPNERLRGGHAVLAVGYDEPYKIIICRNSWGSNWGDKGYFYMPYEYLTNSSLSSDFWTIRE